MDYITIFSLMFICVIFYRLHIGEKIGIRSHLMGCPAYPAFFTTFVYAVFRSGSFVNALVLGFLSAYLSLWLDLSVSISDYYLRKMRKRYSASRKGFIV